MPDLERRPVPLRSKPPAPAATLTRADLARLRQLVALGHAHLGHLLDDASRKETLRSAFILVDGLAAWLRATDPRAFGKSMGSRP